MPTLDPLATLAFFSNGQKSDEGVEITLPQSDYKVYDSLAHSTVYLNLAAHNSANRLIDASRVSVLLSVPGTAQLSEHSYGRQLRLPDGTLMLGGNTIGTLLPDDWSAQTIGIEFPLSEGLDHSIPITLRLLSPTGNLQIPFTCRLEDPPTAARSS
jgi:hypothetical protein